MADLSVQHTARSSSQPAPPAGQEITRQAFEALLQRLDCDRDRAAQRYEQIRSKLIRLFAWRGWTLPEELADETLDRVALKLQAGVEIEVADPYRYICGVAFRVFQEKVREHKRQQRRREEYRWYADSQLAAQECAEEETGEILLECLRGCLHQIDNGERQLILRYYEREKSARIRNRKALARELGLSINTIRIRAFRIRQRLERCTSRCAADS